jgi:hypothetical protein
MVLDLSASGRLVVVMAAALSALSGMTWTRNSAPTSGHGHIGYLVYSDQIMSAARAVVHSAVGEGVRARVEK